MAGRGEKRKERRGVRRAFRGSKRGEKAGDVRVNVDGTGGVLEARREERNGMSSSDIVIKGGGENIRGERREKRMKSDKSDGKEKEEEEIDSRYGEYLYEEWMWGAMREHRFSFPDVGMWYWLMQLKTRLWERYNIFYEADVIGEVYPENEVAGWVWEAIRAKREPRVVWRDREMSYEWLNDWCGRQAPKKMRSFAEEVAVQARRREYREGVFPWNSGTGLKMPTKMKKKILTLEEEARFLAERKRFWKRRRIPVKAQHEAKEPDHVRWDALQQERAQSHKVGCGEKGSRRIVSRAGKGESTQMRAVGERRFLGPVAVTNEKRRNRQKS